MSEQIVLFGYRPAPAPLSPEKKLKRNWENAFQRWCDKQRQDGTTSLGKCGYGYMCDWCDADGGGRPCVRALNAMCREEKISIDYNDRDFEFVWNGFKPF